MATNTKSSVAALVPEVLAETIQAGIAGAEILFGSPAVIKNPTLPGNKRAGDKVQVPYFGHLGDFESVGEGVALTPAAVTSSKEEATVARAGKAIEITEWAMLAAQHEDPYAILSQQMTAGFVREAGRACLAAARTGVSVGMTHDVYNAGTPVTFNYDVMIDAKMKWADEQDDIALCIVHSKTLGDLYKVKDTTGRPMLTDPVNGGLRQFAGIPLLVSDRLTPTAGKYDTLLIKRGAIACWHSEVFVETDKDILKHSKLAAVNVYMACHRYLNLPGFTKSGVVLVQHN